MKDQFIPYEEALALKELGFGIDEYVKSSFFYANDRKLTTNKTGVKRTLKSALGTPYGQNTIEDYESYLVEVDNSSEDYVIALLWQQAFDWFRVEHNIHAIITNYKYEPEGLRWEYQFRSSEGLQGSDSMKTYLSYEEAKLECLRELIKMVQT